MYLLGKGMQPHAAYVPTDHLRSAHRDAFTATVEDEKVTAFEVLNSEIIPVLLAYLVPDGV